MFGLRLAQGVPFFKSDLSVHLANVVFAGLGEVARLNNCSVDVFPPELPHFLLVNSPEKLSDEFRIDGKHFNNFKPKTLQLD